MKKTILTLTVAAASLFATSTVFAGDYRSNLISKSPGGDLTPVEFGSGWYLRADLGYSIENELDVSFTRAARFGDADASASNSYSIGLGFGYVFNDHIRSDVTIEHLNERSWSGSASGCGVDGLGVPYTGDCTSNDGGDFNANNLSLNGYLSLGSMGVFSPYIGAGIGVAHVEYSGTQSNLVCVVDPGENCDLGAHSGATANPETLTGLQTFPGGSSVNITYMLTAGVDYKVDENWSVDVNYRYTDITDGEVFSTGGDSVAFDGAQIHEIRAGLRYEIW